MHLRVTKQFSVWSLYSLPGKTNCICAGISTTSTFFLPLLCITLNTTGQQKAGEGKATVDTWLQRDFMGTKHFHKLNFRNKLLLEGVQPNQHNLELFRNMILLTYTTVCSIPSLQAP